MKFFRLCLLMSIISLAACSSLSVDYTPDRQAVVATKGAEIMPFDLDRTTHIFEPLETGGLQQVIADEPDADEQIRLIRVHLAEEAERFARGDFHDPGMIHGENMPGMHDLVMHADQISIEYSELSNGAQILYTTANADLVEAIHQWFEAQVSDHAEHAQGHR